MRAICVAVLAAAVVWGQANPVLPVRDALQLYERGIQLMESGGFAIPELARAGAPIIENARQVVKTFNSVGVNQSDAALTYTYLTALRAYLALADAVPKPYPFPAEARKQLVELREMEERLQAHFQALLRQKEEQLRGSDRDQLARYEKANTTVGQPVQGRPRVVFLGDSITDGWRLNEYFPGRDFINRGISGQITGQMLGRMKADVLDLKPAAVLILAGTNDIARGVPLATIRNNLTMIADLADHYKIKVILASILPVSDYHKGTNPRFEMTKVRPPSAIRSMNEWIQAFCRERGYTYLDYYSAMVDSSGMLRAELADDGLHPNAAGYRVMAPLALAAIEKTVSGAPVSRTGRRR